VGFKQFIYLLWKGFPDIRITFDDLIIEGNKVAGRYYFTGTHKGEFMDYNQQRSNSKSMV
jgi:predicted ester cyclase